MDKVISARVDESAIDKIGSLAHRLHTSKRKIIERAIEMYAAKIDEEQGFDVFERTCGAWARKESAKQLAGAARKAFRDSMRRHPR